MNDHDEVEWKRVSQTVLEPLRAEPSERFVQNVMRAVRAQAFREDWTPWPVFARWAYPALALSLAGFAVVFFRVSDPVPASIDDVLLGRQEQTLAAQWLASYPVNDSNSSPEAVDL